MSTSREIFAEHILRVNNRLVNQYVNLRHEASLLMASMDVKPSGEMGDFYQRQWIEDSFVKAATAVNHDVKVAVADSMVWAQRGWLYQEFGYREAPGFLLKSMPCCIRPEIEVSIDLVSKIVPVTEGNFTTISLSDLARRSEVLKQKPGETMAILGLNGVGKTTVIDAFKNFCESIGTKMKHVKFPRNDSPVSALIKSIGEGKVQIDPGARQLLFAADLLDYWQSEENNVPIVLADRLPIFDGMVYPDDDTAKLLSLACLEAANYPITPIIIDRHPLVCMAAVKSRPTSPRIYERKLEQMALQTANLVALSELPGVRVVNTDGIDPKSCKFCAGIKVVDAAISSGIFARALVCCGQFDNIFLAREYVKKMGWKWFFEEKKKNNI